MIIIINNKKTLNKYITRFYKIKYLNRNILFTNNINYELSKRFSN